MSSGRRAKQVRIRSLLTFTGQTHEDLPRALEEIALDRDNRALVITGTGDAFGLD